MSYFEKTKLTDNSGNPINPAKDESLTLLRRIFQLLKPLGIISGNGSNRLNIDVNNISTMGTVTTVTTVGTVSTVQNQANMGGVSAFDLMKAMSRTAYNGGIRSKIG